MKRTNEQIASLGLPIQQLDLDQPIYAQLDQVVKDVIEGGGVFRRIDVSERIIDSFGRELERMTPEQRIATKSMSTVPMEWRWRDVPVRCKRSLPDSCIGIICSTPWTRTFRGEDREFLAREKRG